MEFLLPKEQLKGLSAEDQKAVKDEAFNQFLLGSIFGGGGIATGYQAVQNIIPNLQKQRQQQGLLSELGAIQQEFFPTPAQATQRSFINQPGRTSADFGPSPEAALRQQQILNQPIDFNAAYSRLGRLATNPNATPMLPGLASAFQNLQPKVQGDLVLNANQQVLRGLPTQKEGIVSQFNPLTRGYSAAPVQNYMESKILSTPPEVSTNTMLVPMQGGGFTQQVIPGAAGAVETIESAKAIGQAGGQVERVVGADGTEYFVPRSALLTQRPTAGQAGVTTGGVTGGAPSGAVAKASPAQQTLDAATNARFLDFSKNSLESANSASGRKIAAEQLYDLATQINNNKLTGLQAGVYSYMNAIPGVGKLFEQDITDVTRMNQMIKTAQLEKTAMQKGAASNLDATTIEKSYASITDPASSTRMAAAFEVALADKDIAKNQFVEAYRGDPSKINTAWQNSPDNRPVFAHPKFNQFLTEQVNSWVQGGAQGKPVLPAGFQLGTGKTSGSYLIKRPDGTIYRIGQ